MLQARNNSGIGEFKLHRSLCVASMLAVLVAGALNVGASASIAAAASSQSASSISHPSQPKSWPNHHSASRHFVQPHVTVQFFSGLETGQTQPAWTNMVDTGTGGGGIANVGGYCCGLNGPETNIHHEGAHTGTSALLYSGSNSGGAAHAYTEVFDLSAAPINVGAATGLSYWIYPQANNAATAANVSGHNSTCVSIDLIFSDGTALRSLGAQDENGNQLNPGGQCNNLTLDDWNLVTSNIGSVASGKQIVRIDLGYSQPSGSGGYRGYVDDISITDQTVAATADPAALVNPFIGTGNSGATDGNIDTFPGADVPFGMVQWSPDTSPDRQPGGGYSYGDNSISGFSLTHLSGPGCARYGDIPILPTVGGITGAPGSATQSFNHVTQEQSSPGYYQVQLGGNILTELSVTPRTGYGVFTFPSSTQANVLVKVGGSANADSAATAQIVGNNEIEGSATSGHFCNSPGTYTVYFAAQFDQSFTSHGTWTGGGVTGGSSAVSDPNGGAYVTFNTTSNPVVQMKVGISYVSEANALLNLNSEDSGWNFSQVESAAHASWDNVLSNIQIQGGTFPQLQMFYSELYHSLLHPNLFSDVNGQYPGFDSQTHTVSGNQNAQYANFSGWDIYRSQIQLLAMVAPSQTGDMMQSYLNEAIQGGWFDRWPAANDYTGIISGDAADAIISDAYAFGVHNFDAQTALTQMIKGATQFPTPDQYGQGWFQERPELPAYQQLGYVPNLSPSLPSPVDIGGSVTLEYSTDDFDIAQLAKALGDNSDYTTFMAKGQNWQNLFNPATGYIQPRDGTGAFPVGNPTTVEIEGGNDQAGFAEGNAAQYTWQVPQNLHALFNAIGGNAAVNTRLDTFFTQLNAGRIAPYEWAGNEPGFEQPWEYDYAGAPYKTQNVVRQIVNTLFSPTPGGEPGNEDLGAMGSWYVWGALGLYPETPGTPVLALASPLFPSATITLQNGNQVVIQGNGAAANAPYVQSLTVNGTPTQNTWLSMTDLLNGPATTTVSYTLGQSANQSWGSAPANAPPSYSDGQSAAIPFLSSPSVSVTPGGADANVNVEGVNVTDASLTVDVQPSPPSGVTVDCGSGSFDIALNAQAGLQCSVSAAGNAPSGVYSVPIALSSGGQSLPTVQLAVTVAAGTIEHFFNSRGISSDNSQWTSDLDGGGNSYSYESLAQAGLAPGSTIAGVTMPQIPAGLPDNVVAGGQVIAVPAVSGASTVAFLGSESNGPGSGTVTLTYTDATTQQQTLGFSDWTLNGGSAGLSYGNLVAASLPNRNCTCDDTETAFTPMPHHDAEATYMFLATVPVNPAKTLASVTLPGSVSNGHMHIFALAPRLPGTTPVIQSITPANPIPGTTMTVTGTGFGATQSAGYLHFTDNGQSWGAPGNASTFVIDSWSDTQITFTMPVPSGSTNQWRTMPNSTATVTVTNAYALTSTNSTVNVPNTDNPADYYTGILVSPDSSRGCGGLNATYLSANLLAANTPSIVPGGTVTTGAFTFTWPSPANCFYDSIQAGGQTILMDPKQGVTQLGLLGTGDGGNTSGELMVNYTTGSPTAVTASFDDWCSGNLATNNTRVAMMSYRNDSGNQQNVSCDLFLDTLSGLDPNRTIASITLPSPGDSHMRIFAIAMNGQFVPQLTWNNPADIVYGTALSATQLDAQASVAGVWDSTSTTGSPPTTNVAGTFAYTPPLGTVLSAGNNQPLSATFTPSDTTDYTGGQPSPVTASINVGKAGQTITFTGPSQTTYTYPTNSGFTMTATGGGSGNPVTFSIDSGSTAGACTSGGTHGSSISITGTGSCVVDGNQTGNSNYSAASQTTDTFTINQANRASQTINFTGPSKTTYLYGTDSGFTVTATGGGSGNPVTFSIDSSSTAGACSSGGANGSSITITGAGSCIVDANQAGNTSYLPAPQVTDDFTINKTSQTVNFTGPSQTTYTYGDSSFTVTATGGGSGNAVTFSIDSASAAGACTSSGTHGATITITGVGSCIVDGNQAGSANYSAAPKVTDRFTIVKAALTIKPVDQSIRFGAVLPNLSLPAYWVATGYVNGNGNSALTTMPTCALTAHITDGKGRISVKPGAYNLACHGATAANYLITYATGTLTVTKQIVTLTYGGPLSVKKGSTVTLKGTVKGAGAGIPSLSGVKLTMTFKGGKSCRGVTNSSGVATCKLNAPAKAGTVPLTLKYAGSIDYLVAIKTVNVKVKA